MKAKKKPVLDLVQIAVAMSIQGYSAEPHKNVCGNCVHLEIDNISVLDLMADGVSCLVMAKKGGAKFFCLLGNFAVEKQASCHMYENYDE